MNQRRNWTAVILAAGFLVALAAAFLAGMTFANRANAPEGADAGREEQSSASSRAMFSPSILKDPAFRERQRENVAALELHCRQTGSDCAEAEQARRWLEENGN